MVPVMQSLKCIGMVGLPKTKKPLVHIKVLESNHLSLYIPSLPFNAPFCIYKKQQSCYKVRNKILFLALKAIAHGHSELQQLRNDVDTYSHRIYKHSCKIAEASNISVIMPRVTSRQTHRSNPPYASAEDYFKNVVAILSLDY